MCVAFFWACRASIYRPVSNLINMIPNPKYRLRKALMDDGVTEQFVIADEADQLHVASSWLLHLAGEGRSPNTIKQYGSRVAWYLSWTVQTTDWRGAGLSHLTMWKRVLTTSAAKKTNGASGMRSKKTVALWITPLRSFYEWADAHQLLTSDIASRLTEIKYFPPGTPAGGEYGKKRKVLTEQLRPSRITSAAPPEWIDTPVARQKLETLPLRTRDRFLIDLMYFTGIRAGEALSLFSVDMHFSGGSKANGCHLADAHFHINLDNPVENGARAKGCQRVLHVPDHIVEKYIDYLLDRNKILNECDTSPHVFVNVYSQGKSKGRAMKYSNVRRLVIRCSKKISFPMKGPHVLRHTFASRLLRGIDCVAQDIDVVQGLMGHASIDSTRIYSHGLEAGKKAAIQGLAPRSLDLDFCHG